MGKASSPQGRSRAQRVHDDAAARLHPDRPFVHSTAFGDVHIAQVTYRRDGDVDWVEVWTAGENLAGDPHFRVINPPVLAADPAGDIEIGGRRFREDPLAALAEAIASGGGASRGAR